MFSRYFILCHLNKMYIFFLNYQPTELKKNKNSNYFVEMEVFS